MDKTMLLSRLNGYFTEVEKKKTKKTLSKTQPRQQQKQQQHLGSINQW